MNGRDFAIVAAVVVVALVIATSTGFLSPHRHNDPSCPNCPDCPPDKRGPRPHSLVVEECHAGKPILVHCGDVVRVKLPCSLFGGCFRQTGGGIPHMVHEGDESGGVFRYRAACPGQCVLRFGGPRDVEFTLNVRP